MNTFGLEGKVALITGSSRGIGKEIARKLKDCGCTIILNARNEAALKATAQEIGAAGFYLGDVSQADTAKKIMAQIETTFGKLDILVCNVGSGKSVPPGEETLEEWKRVFEINLWSTTNSVQFATPLLKASQGNIVCISSICGLESIPGAPLTYSAAKSALHSYVKGAARVLGASGIRINAIAPGNIDFDGSVWSQKKAQDPKSVEKMLQEKVALKKLGTPTDVAELVAFLSSLKANFATGAIWTLDGGQVH